MDLSFTLWNVDNGFLDGVVRGWRSTFLTDVEYANLKEGGRRGGSGGAGKAAKEDFEDMRLTLQETDYGNFLSGDVSLRDAAHAKRARRAVLRRQSLLGGIPEEWRAAATFSSRASLSLLAHSRLWTQS